MTFTTQEAEEVEMGVTQEQMLKDCSSYLESCGIDLEDVIDDKDTLIEEWVVDYSNVSLLDVVHAVDCAGVELKDAIITACVVSDSCGYPETVVEVRHAIVGKGSVAEQLREALDYIYWHLGAPFYGEYKAAFKLVGSVK